MTPEERAITKLAGQIADEICAGYGINAGSAIYIAAGLEWHMKRLIAQEREVCARLAEEDCDPGSNDPQEATGLAIAEAIRARGTS